MATTNTCTSTPVGEARTQHLIREFAALKVWFAVNEVSARHPDGKSKHSRLCAVVNELRSRHVLD